MGVFVSSCIYIDKGDRKEKEEKEQQEQNDYRSSEGNEIEINNLDDAMDALSDALGGLKDGEAVEAMDFQELKKMLPERMLGMKRISHEGERAGMGKLKFSTATAEYQNGDASLEVSIVDGGGFAGIMAGMAAWSSVEMDKENEDGYERTTMIDGHKAFEQYDRRNKNGQIALIVDDRFIVSVDGDKVSEKDLRKALDALNLKKIRRAI